MALSWNEIKERAVKFSKEWENYSNEEADAKPFLVEFFNIFGIYSKKVATFEHRVKKLDERDGYIDLLWKGTILIEMKSRGKNLDKAFQQAKDYLHGLKQHELPKYILVSDFEIFKLYDLEEENILEFRIADLVNNVQSFGFLLGYQKKVYKEQDPANIKAAESMGKLHDRLKEIGYDGHPLEVYLVRLLFCLFAEDTTIFNKQQFQDYIEFRTNEDGSDLAPKLQELFQVLDTQREKRFKNLDEQLAEFPYVNGKLFHELTHSAHHEMSPSAYDSLIWKAYADPGVWASSGETEKYKSAKRTLESWATAIEITLTNLRYQRLGYPNHRYKLNYKNTPNYQNIELTNADDVNNFYTSVFYDLTDNFNQRQEYYWLPNMAQDRVSGFTIKQVQDIIKGSQSWGEVKGKLRSQYPNTANLTDELLTNWQ